MLHKRQLYKIHIPKKEHIMWISKLVINRANLLKFMLCVMRYIIEEALLRFSV